MEQNLKTINIKGKLYIEVNERLKFFRTSEQYAGWSIETEIINLTETYCVLKAVIKNTEGRVIATGLAQEDKDSSLVNETSFIENCETSAWGRALANLGIGIDTSVASANEVHTAINKQERNSSQRITEYNNQQAPMQRAPLETRVFKSEFNGQFYDVEYVKRTNKQNGNVFWALKDPTQAQYFPKFRNCEE